MKDRHLFRKIGAREVGRKFSVCWNNHFFEKHSLAASFRNTGFINLDRNVCIFNILGKDIFVYISIFHCKVPVGSNTCR